MRSLALGAMAALLVFPALAAPQEFTADTATDARSTLQAAVIMRALNQVKAVPRGDKAAVEIIGTVADAYSITDKCSGSPVRVVWVTSKAAPLNPVGAGCAGGSFGSCASLHPGQRVRLQGVLVTLPDPTALGFNVCDPSTWLLPLGPLETFLVTKVTK
jgi:hypothetical protein